jgi:hypothetical protein
LVWPKSHLVSKDLLEAYRRPTHKCRSELKYLDYSLKIRCIQDSHINWRQEGQR